MSILRKAAVLIGITLTAITISGCAGIPLKITEIMQKPAGTRYYLAHNVWTDGKRSISSINYQVGSILPFGTEIKVVKLTSKVVVFEVVSTGIEYTIKYHERYGMKPMEDYVKQLISTNNKEELSKGASEDFIRSMTDGVVLPGMTRKQVILTYGAPSPHRTPNLDNPTWVYWLRKWPVSRTSRVIFKGDKVLEVVK